MRNNSNVGIVGAGIQGISNALFLQKKVLRLHYLIEMNLVARPRRMETLDISLHMRLYL